MYPLFGPPGPLTPHIDAPQLGFGLEKPFLTPGQSDWKMTHTNAKYQGDRFRPKQWNLLHPTQPVPQSQLQTQYFPTNYAIPCTSGTDTVLPSMDMSVQPQCSTCLRLLRPSNISNTGSTCLPANSQFPNGAIANTSVNMSEECRANASNRLNTCGVQCGCVQNTETTSVSGWPPALVTALSM